MLNLIPSLSISFVLLNNFAPDETLHNSEAFLLSFSSLNFTSYFSIYFVRFVQKMCSNKKFFFSLSINSLFIFCFVSQDYSSLSALPLHPSIMKRVRQTYLHVYFLFSFASLSLSLSFSIKHTQTQKHS